MRLVMMNQSRIVTWLQFSSIQQRFSIFRVTVLDLQPKALLLFVTDFRFSVQICILCGDNAVLMSWLGLGTKNARLVFRKRSRLGLNTWFWLPQTRSLSRSCSKTIQWFDPYRYWNTVSNCSNSTTIPSASWHKSQDVNMKCELVNMVNLLLATDLFFHSYSSHNSVKSSD